MTKRLILLTVCVLAWHAATAQTEPSPALPQTEPPTSPTEYIRNLKPTADKHWPGFDDPRFDVPLILIDTLPFRMSTSITFGDDTTACNYRSPVILGSSFEITRETIPGVSSVEEWATMIMHEYFHGFQFRHPDFLDHYEKIVLTLPSQDTLKHIYSHNERFKNSVDLENTLLLAAIDSGDRDEIRASIETFFRLRRERREEIKQSSGFDIAPLEQIYETMEGTARYVEHALTPDDSPWMYRTDRTTWFYATGFNMARLLDRLKIEYKSRLFNEGTLSLEQILRNEYDN